MCARLRQDNNSAAAACHVRRALSVTGSLLVIGKFRSCLYSRVRRVVVVVLVFLLFFFLLVLLLFYCILIAGLCRYTARQREYFSKALDEALRLGAVTLSDIRNDNKPAYACVARLSMLQVSFHSLCSPQFVLIAYHQEIRAIVETRVVPMPSDAHTSQHGFRGRHLDTAARAVTAALSTPGVQLDTLARRVLQQPGTVPLSVIVASDAVCRAAQHTADQDPSLAERILWTVLSRRPQWERKCVEYELATAAPTFVPGDL